MYKFIFLILMNLIGLNIHSTEQQDMETVLVPENVELMQIFNPKFSDEKAAEILGKNIQYMFKMRAKNDSKLGAYGVHLEGGQLIICDKDRVCGFYQRNEKNVFIPVTISDKTVSEGLFEKVEKAFNDALKYEDQKIIIEPKEN